MQEPPDLLNDLNRFASEVWGNPRALMRRLPPRDVEFIDLGEYFRAFRRISSNIIQHQKILVREEYRTALQVLQTKKYRRGAYVTGQPGIGKTYFLVYALVHFLGKKQPVAIHHLGGIPSYFLFQDNVTLYHIHNDAPLYKCNTVWALSDSNADTLIPPAIFRGNASRIRVIQTTSPNASRYKEWSKQYGASCYIMDIWTEKEVENLATLLELDVERMATLAKKWGTIPRTLLTYIDEEDQEVEDLYHGSVQKAVEKSPVRIDGALQLNFPTGTEAPSLFYFVRPRKVSTGVVYRDLPGVTVQTRTLRELLGKGLQGQNNQVKLDFYMALSQYAETRHVAGCIFASWVHSFVLAGKEMRCQWIAQGSGRAIAKLPTALAIPGTDVLIPTTSKSLTTGPQPYYWLSPRTNFPGVDSILVLENEIFVFQISISADLESPIGGLNTLRNHLQSDLKKKACWRVVFVGPQKNYVQGVAEHWAGKLYFPTAKTCVPVAWSDVDPTRENIIYKAYRDEEMMEVDEH